jgi:SAM-dependent methyltransferase
MSSESLQAAHYDRIHAEYERHYDDAWSRAYRARFMYAPMFGGIDLAGKTVLEAMCGSGQTTQYLLDRGARVTGVDVSASAMESFQRRWPGCRAICRSILDTGLEDESFDGVAVVGGLHHLHPHLNEAVEEIFRVLKIGGHFCFIEPHAGSLSDVVRKRWYKVDPMFADNEAAVDVDALRKQFGTHFDFLTQRYFGNLAYLLVLNSMVFRIPPPLKRCYGPLLMVAEGLLQRFQGRLFSCCVVCQWRKTESQPNARRARKPERQPAFSAAAS